MNEKLVVSDELGLDAFVIEKDLYLTHASLFIIHHKLIKIYKSESREHHTQILSDDFSRTFAALRDEAGF